MVVGIKPSNFVEVSIIIIDFMALPGRHGVYKITCSHLRLGGVFYSQG
jgi:hypothetical protein